MIKGNCFILACLIITSCLSTSNRSEKLKGIKGLVLYGFENTSFFIPLPQHSMPIDTLYFKSFISNSKFDAYRILFINPEINPNWHSYYYGETVRYNYQDGTIDSCSTFPVILNYNFKDLATGDPYEISFWIGNKYLTMKIIGTITNEVSMYPNLSKNKLLKIMNQENENDSLIIEPWEGR